MKVLVVDDTAPNRKLLCRALGGWGHQVSEAENGAQALQRFQEDPAELVLMDVMMPGMDGMETARQLRLLPGGDETSLIFVTAVRENEGLIPALESGGDSYVTKPVDLAVLQAQIKAHQRIRELSRQLAEQNHLLLQRNRELQREHDIVDHFFARIQDRNFVPGEMLRFHASSASAFSGDLLLAEPRPGGGLYLLVGDFTGKGLSAAMGSLPVAVMFSRLAGEGQPIGGIARQINRLLATYLPSEIFLAATLVEMDATGTLVHCWAGGLPDGMILTAAGDVRPLASQHMPLGILNDAEFDASVATLQLPVGSRLLLLTDGISEAVNGRGEQFGETRIRALCDALPSGADALAALQTAVTQFTARQAGQDDVVVAELTCRPLAPRGRSDDTSAPGCDIPMRITLRLGGPELAQGGIIEHLVAQLSTAPAARAHRPELHTVLSELISNAVDHGLLGIASSEREGTASYRESRNARLADLPPDSLIIDAALRRSEDVWRLRIRVQHAGQARPVNAGPRDEDAPHGRGLLILDALCESLTLSDDGREACAVYRLD